MNLSFRGLGILNYENSNVSGENCFINNKLPQYISSNSPVIFDVGANVGCYSEAVLKRFPNAQLFAFEPHPVNFQRLKERLHGNARLFNQAMGNKNGLGTLYDLCDAEGSEHASFYEDVISKIHGKKATHYQVHLETLDDFCRIHQVENIAFLKIDTEGHEFAVLEGAKKLLDTRAIECIQFEFNEMNRVSRVCLSDFQELLKDYDLYRLLPGGLLKLDERITRVEVFAFQNIVAIAKRRVTFQ